MSPADRDVEDDLKLEDGNVVGAMVTIAAVIVVIVLFLAWRLIS